MEPQFKAQISRQRDVNMFGELSAASYYLIERIAEDRTPCIYDLMACIVLVAFKFEAFLNHVGPQLLPNWSELDRRSRKRKLDVLLGQLSVHADFERRPFSTIEELLKVRDSLAHARPQRLVQNREVELGSIEELRRRRPLTECEKKCTLDFARMADEDTEAIALEILTAARLDPSEFRSMAASYTIHSKMELDVD